MSPNSSEMLARRSEREPPTFIFLGETPDAAEQADWQKEARVHGDNPKFAPGVAVFGYMAKKLERGPQGRGGDAMLADQKTGLTGVFDGLGGHNKEDIEADGRAAAKAAEALPQAYEMARLELHALIQAKKGRGDVDAYLDSQVAYAHPHEKAALRQKKDAEIAKYPRDVQIEVLTLYKSALALSETVRETGGATTMTVGKTVMTPDGRAFEVILSVGDSGASLYRKDGSATDVTKEDSAVDYLIGAGRLTPAEAAQPDHVVQLPKGPTTVRQLRMQMLQSIGQDAGRPLHPTVTVVELRPGDRIQYATDGIRDVIGQDGVHDPRSNMSVMRKAKNFDGALENLIDASENAKGPDGEPAKDDDKAVVLKTYDPKVRG